MNIVETAAAGSQQQRVSRDDWKKQKQLDEARKAGTAPAALDEDGKEINPHIPQYIAVAPWYLNNEKPSLKHQKSSIAKPAYVTDWYQRGQKLSAPQTKFRKGACTNCGAVTHTIKFCCERPRALGAKWTGKDIQPDEIVQDILLDFDGKRDRWNGYDPATYKKVVDQYEKTEVERKKKKKEEEMKSFMTEPDPSHQRYPHSKDTETQKIEGLVDDALSDDSDNELGEDKDDFLDTTEQPVGVKKDTKTRTTVRNLRIREDTAKYLRNLDINSAYYDPKSRSMRENPTPNAKPDEQIYAGDNFVRFSGDVNKFNGIQRYAWQTFEDGSDIHLQAAPSQAELLYRDHKHTTEVVTMKNKDAILAKYGGQEHLVTPETAKPITQVAQTEEYIEYTREGAIKGALGAPKVVAKSKYEEDVYIHNHKSVWGSYWEDGQWGYACCRQFVKNSYCTGEAGIQARKELIQDEMNRLENAPALKPKDPEPTNTPKKKKTLEEAIKEEEQRTKEEKDERRRGYNSLGQDYEVTEEEMEAYRLKRQKFEDPMKNFIK